MVLATLGVPRSFFLPSSLTPSKLPNVSDRGSWEALWPLEMDPNYSFGLLATCGQLCPVSMQLWWGPASAEDPSLAWVTPPSASPSLSSTQKAQPGLLPRSSSLACPSSTAALRLNLVSPSATEGRPPMLAGNHPSVPRGRDQNRPPLGPTLR